MMADVRRLFGPILGLVSREEKCILSPPGLPHKHLGLMVSVAGGEIRIALSAERRAGLRAHLEDVLQRGRLLPGEAAVIAGKLQFGCAALFGRLGRAYLGAFFCGASQRHVFYSKADNCVAPLTEHLRAAIAWWLVFLRDEEAAAFERGVPIVCSADSDVFHLLYTDASTSAIAGVLLGVRNCEGASKERN